MRRLLRILQFTVLSIVVLVLLLVGSIPFDAAIGGGRVAALTNTSITGPDGDIRAYVARPATAGPHPAVIMVHEWWGLRPDVIEKADLLAAQGYLVIAPDTFRGSSTTWIPRAIYQVATTQPERITTDLDAVFAWLTAQPDVASDRVAVIGFCYGGRAALNYTIHNPAIAATGIFYGMMEPTAEQLAGIRGPVLGIWGGADTSIPLEEVERLEQDLRAAGVATSWHVFDGQPHAFVGGVDDIRAGGAAGEAWQILEQFLQDSILTPSSGTVNPTAPAFSATSLTPTDQTISGALHHWFVCELPT